MICLGKSFRNSQRDGLDNKENIDHNVVRQKVPDKVPKEMRATVVRRVSEVEAVGERLKRDYSQQVAAEYSEEIFEHMKRREQNLESFLAHHTISASLRAKMVDWMIQVLSSYKMSEEAFFRSVALMDGYLKHEDKMQDTKDIHLIGVAAMFTAMKFQEIHPLHLTLISQKIARKKFDKKEIIGKESRILFVLGFDLEFTTTFDLVRHINHAIILDLKPSLFQYLQKILIYLSKMCAFSHHLVTRPSVTLASAIYFIALKTLEQVNKSLCPQDLLPDISAFTGVSEEQILSIGREVLELAKTFSKIYPNLNNLKKFNRFQYQNQ